MPYFWLGSDVWAGLMSQINAIRADLRQISTQMSVLLQIERMSNMATQQELDDLNTQVAANTSATQSAAQALTGFVQTVKDLTDQLQAALNNNDSAAVQAATAALAANNAALMAAIPATAQAVTENTPAAGG